MLTVRGIYENGEVKLLDKVPASSKQKVLITFIEDEDDTTRTHSLNQTSQEFRDYLSNEQEELYQDYLKK
jgi:predicted DNA-binding antitoxin AbrB/MazE fold protein